MSAKVINRVKDSILDGKRHEFIHALTATVFFIAFIFMAALPVMGQSSGSSPAASAPAAPQTKLSEPAELLRTAENMNRLAYPGATPWHLKSTYETLDLDGHKTGHGVYEVFYAGPNKYKEIYESKQFSQTNYRTDHGVFRTGEKLWAYGPERMVNFRLLPRFPNDDALRATTQQLQMLPIDGPALRCISLDRKSPSPAVTRTIASTYCLDPNNLALRYEAGVGVTTYEITGSTSRNDNVVFHDHFVAREIVVKLSDKPYLRIHVDILEDLPKIDEAIFQPPADAVTPDPAPVIVPDTAMSSRLLKRVAPGNVSVSANVPIYKYVALAIVVGADGRVVGVRPLSGDKSLESDVVKAVNQWVYRPFTVNDKPVMAESEVVESFGQK